MIFVDVVGKIVNAIVTWTWNRTVGTGVEISLLLQQHANVRLDLAAAQQLTWYTDMVGMYDYLSAYAVQTYDYVTTDEDLNWWLWALFLAGLSARHVLVRPVKRYWVSLRSRVVGAAVVV